MSIPSPGAGIRNNTGVLIPSEPIISFGTVPQGGKHSHYFALKNPTAAFVRIDRIDSDCDCLEVILSEMEIAPGGNVLARVTLDLSSANHFVGKLASAVQGLTSRDDTAFLLKIGADVRAALEFGNLEPARPTANRPAPVVNPIPIPMPVAGNKTTDKIRAQE